MDIKEFEQYADEEIVRLVESDKAFFGILIRRYEGRLASYLRKMSGANKETIEDVLQNIFIKAFVNINSFKSDQKFSNWLYRVSRNECIDYWRKNKKHASSVSLEGNEKLLSVLASEENLGENLLNKFKEEEVRMALDELPYKYKEVLVLRYLEDKEYEEISDILNKPVSTVGTLLRRAKINLKNIYSIKDGSR